jgi:glycosyltransferase involved in cell wall biosynthesis
LSQKLGVPYVLSIRGDTDFKVIRYKPTYAGLYRHVLRDSRAIFFVAPWSMRKLTELWPQVLLDRKVLLPNIIATNTSESADNHEKSNHLVSVFHLRDYRRKNLKRLLSAVDSLNRVGSEVTLDVIGGGSASTISRIEKMISDLQFPQNIRLLGHLSSGELSRRLPHYSGLILPSTRETFGMVYLEALRAGLPFVHSENAGVDGYFDDVGVSIAVKPKSVRSIADGIRKLLNDQPRLQRNIQQLHESGGLDRFNTANIVHTYSETLSSVLSKI